MGKEPRIKSRGELEDELDRLNERTANLEKQLSEKKPTKESKEETDWRDRPLGELLFDTDSSKTEESETEETVTDEPETEDKEDE